jgi:uncharacterized protein (DUF952 family)
VHDPVAYHLLPAEIWDAADPSAPLRVPSLETDGFVHLTHRMTDLVEVANAFYRDDPGLHVVLTVRLASLTSAWRYDGDDRFPHVYGRLDRGAITEVRPIDRADDGTFLPIERADPRKRPDIPALLGALDAAGVDFLVVGSGGAALLGAALDPGDLDVCVATDDANLDRVGVALRAVGARPRVSVPGWVTPEEAAAWRPERTPSSLELLFETRQGDLDILFASLGPERRGEIPYEELIGSSITIELAGRPVRVASPEHLLGSKLAARRPKDLRAREALERLVAETSR